MKKISIFSIIAVVVIFLAFMRSGAAGELENFQIKAYKSPSCGCCGYYMDFLKAKGAEVDINSVTDNELAGIKSDFGIPANMRSCHVITVGNYFVEGHVPTEAVIKLLEEAPDIDGIALPGMPSGSPGMPGPKGGPFVIYSIKDGEVIGEFMRI